jgi:hypothetical protein
VPRSLIGPARAVGLVLAAVAVLLVARSATGPLPAPPAPADDLAGPAGTVLYLGGPEPLRVELGTGAVARLPGVAGRPAQVLQLEGVTLALTGGSAVALPGRRLGRADAALASPVPGRVWLVGADFSGVGRYVLTEVSLATGRRLATRELPARSPPVAVTRAGVITRDLLDGGLELRDVAGWRHPLELAADATFVDAHDDLVAWVDRRGLHLYELPAGPDRLVQAPAGLAWTRIGGVAPVLLLRVGAFSPDGRALAVFTEVTSPGQPGLALVDVGRATAASVAGSQNAIPGSCAACLSWQPAGDWLFYLGAPPWRVGAFRVGGPAGPLALDLDIVGRTPGRATASRAPARH